MECSTPWAQICEPCVNREDLSRIGLAFMYLLNLNLLNCNGIIHLPFLVQSIIIIGISRLELEVGQPTV